MANKKQSTHTRWSSKWTFILATTGAAVGLGNIWKFPYITGENGGGAFVLVYLVCIFLVGLPLLIAELVLGRLGRRNPIAAMRALALASQHKPYWQLIGGLTMLAGALVLSYYSMIAGWALHYTVQSAFGHFHQMSATQADYIFNSLMVDPLLMVFLHTIIMAITMIIVMFGVQAGLEYAIRYLLPGIIIILAALVVYAIMATGYFEQALIYLFKPDFNVMSTQSVLIALGHAFFTLSLALGINMAYGAYVPSDVSIIKASTIIVMADTLVALLAGMAIFPIVFAHGLAPSAGPGLIFQTLPIALGGLPYGSFFATAFFIMVVFAALASTIALIEPSVAWLIEKYNISRIQSTLIAGLVIWLFGFISIFSFNIWSQYTLFSLNLFSFIDYLTANIMLPLGGLLIAIFTVWILKKKLLLKGLMIHEGVFFYSLRFVLGIIAPIAIILIFLNAVGII